MDLRQRHVGTHVVRVGLQDALEGGNCFGLFPLHEQHLAQVHMSRLPVWLKRNGFPQLHLRLRVVLLLSVNLAKEIMGNGILRFPLDPLLAEGYRCRKLLLPDIEFQERRQQLRRSGIRPVGLLELGSSLIGLFLHQIQFPQLHIADGQLRRLADHGPSIVTLPLSSSRN